MSATAATPHKAWPPEGLARVPYWVYQDAALYAEEQQKIFRGATWNFLCLDAELAGPDTWRTSNIGEMPVVVTRDAKGELAAFENRCAHRGALLCLKPCGEAKEIACVYHNWTYDLKGNLQGVAFRRGIKGSGGMPADAKPESGAPAKVRIENFHGLVFGTLSDATPPVEAYFGPDVAAKVRRVMKAPVKSLGGYSQMVPSNWKLYMENVKDTYHASLLHLFFTKFRINRLSQKGGVIVGGDGGCHVSYTISDPASKNDEYEKAGMRSAGDGFALEAPELIESVEEIGDGVTVQIVGIFPGFVLQQIKNCLAVRRIVPRGLNETELLWTAFGYTDDSDRLTVLRLRQSNLIGPAGFISMEDGAATGFVQRGVAAAGERAAVVEMGGRSVESNESRVTETSVRGFWQAWRRHIGI
jgi:anthranilate 1,2-dioxygenase large subunit/terephthalate 1,2-dioxygenase oxygenase component alpha subunit